MITRNVLIERYGHPNHLSISSPLISFTRSTLNTIGFSNSNRSVSNSFRPSPTPHLLFLLFYSKFFYCAPASLPSLHHTKCKVFLRGPALDFQKWKHGFLITESCFIFCLSDSANFFWLDLDLSLRGGILSPLHFSRRKFFLVGIQNLYHRGHQIYISIVPVLSKASPPSTISAADQARGV